MISGAFGSGVQAAGDSFVFYRGYAPPERPKYRGSGQCDIWRMTGSGESASFVQLTTDGANDYDPAPLPDGSVLFISSRDGEDNVWRVGPGGGAGGGATQLTSFKPTAEEISIGHGVRDLAVSANGSVAVFCVWDKMYRLDLNEAKPAPKPLEFVAQADDVMLDLQRMTLDKEVSEAALSPDGKTLAVVARGEVFVRNVGEGYPTRRVTSTPGRERDIAWSPDGRVLYFASDDPGLAHAGADGLGKYAVYAASVDLSREDISPRPAKPEDKAEKKDDAEKKPDDKKDEAKDDKNADEKKDDKADKPKSKKPDFGKRWADALRFRIEPVFSDAMDVRHPVPSPDAKCLLVTRGRGDLIMIELEHLTPRVLFESWNEPEAQWAADSRHIVYAQEDLDFNSDIWLLDTGGFDSFAGAFTPGKPVNLTKHPDNDVSPRLSADGKVLTFLSERGEQSDQMDVYQVYLDKGLEGMTAYERDDYYKKASEAAGKRKPAETPAFILKDLVAKGDRAMKADEKKDNGKGDGKGEEKGDEKKAPGSESRGTRKPEPLKFDAEDAYLRIRRITSGPGSKGSLDITPAADRIIFSGVFDGEGSGSGGTSLVSIDYKGGDRKTLVSGAVSGLSVSLTGDKVVYVKSGTVGDVPPKGGKTESLPIDAPVAVDIVQQQRQKFLEAARTFGDRFYHPTMKGLDWNGLTRRYLSLAEKTRTAEAFNRIVQLLFGETEGSHTGIYGGAAFNPPSPGTGYLGVHVKPIAGGYQVLSVTPDSPASLKLSRINVGDVIVAVDSKRLSPDDNTTPTLDLDAALMGRAGRETLVELKRAAAPAPSGAAEEKNEPKTSEDQKEPGPESRGTQSPFVVITPVNGAAWTSLCYDEEVSQRRALTEKLSGGKIGYLHIRAMSGPEVRDYERDLYAAGSGKEALLIDVRDNGGGWTTDILLASLTAPSHAYTIPRGADPSKVPHDAYPRDRRLIYAWSRPIDVLINEHSFSNAEIFAHAIHTIRRGRLVGTATFGGVISTGAFTLIDGTTVRMPFRGWYLPDGTDMESHGAQPDVDVPQTPADEASGKDPQLEAAVEDLMKQIPK
ncbi:MAG TPA: S41 family peptidase [Phycisphaerales bacterium]|nr:S41 family peptidase [Phycisphaerales bacterium]